MTKQVKLLMTPDYLHRKLDLPDDVNILDVQYDIERDACVLTLRGDGLPDQFEHPFGGATMECRLDDVKEPKADIKLCHTCAGKGRFKYQGSVQWCPTCNGDGKREEDPPILGMDEPPGWPPCCKGMPAIPGNWSCTGCPSNK